MPPNIVEQEVFQEGSARPAALLRLRNAGQVVPHRRNARLEALHTGVFAGTAVLPAQNANPGVCRKNRRLNNIPEFIILLKM